MREHRSTHRVAKIGGGVTSENARRNRAALKAMTATQKLCGKTTAELDAEQAALRQAFYERAGRA